MSLTVLYNQSKQINYKQGLKTPYLLLKTWFTSIFLDMCMKLMAPWGGGKKQLILKIETMK